MFDRLNIISRRLVGEDQLLCEAQLPGHTHTYQFIAHPDKIVGKTSTGSWLLLSKEAEELLRPKINQ